MKTILDFKKIIRKFFDRTNADVSIEFVIILPVILSILAAIYELTMYSLAYNKLSRVTQVIGEIISRQNISQSTILSYCTQASKIMSPFDFAVGAGSIVVSQVQNTGSTSLANNVTISWQVKYNNATSKFGGVGANPGFPKGLLITNDKAAIIVEAYYTYQPTVFNFFTVRKQLYQVNFFVPRVGRMSTLLPN